MVDADTIADFRKALSRPIHSVEYIDRSSTLKYPEDILKDISDFERSLYWTAPIGYYDQLSRINPDTFKISENQLSFYPDYFGEVMREAIGQELSGDTYVTQTVQNHATHARKFLQLKDSKITPMISTDAGSPAQFHNDAIWHEFQTWHSYGVAMDEILTAATVNPAEMLGWKNTGKIAPGYNANIILYDGDFLKGEIDKEALELVMKDGLIFLQDGEWVWEK